MTEQRHSQFPLLQIDKLTVPSEKGREDDLGFPASPESRNQLASIAVRKRVKAGDTLFWEGDASNYVYKLVSGAAKGFKLLPNGSSQITRFYISGEMISIAAIETYCCSVEALTECELVQYPRARFEAIADSDPLLRRALAALIAHELEETHKQVLLLGRMPAVDRVSQFLIDFGSRVMKSAVSADPAERLIVELPMTRADIADYLGLTIETVSRVFTKFRRDGFIDLARPNVVRFRNSAWFQGQAQTLAA